MKANVKIRTTSSPARRRSVLGSQIETKKGVGLCRWVVFFGGPNLILDFREIPFARP